MNVTRESALNFLDTVFRIALGGIFIYAAWTKMMDPGLFASAVNGYRILPAPAVAFVAIALPPLELLAGLGLVFTRWQRESALLILCMLGVFLVGLVQAQVRGLDIGCGCFGGTDKDTVVGAIVRDVFMLAPAIWLVARKNRPAWKWTVLAPLAVAVAAALAFLATDRGKGGDYAQAAAPDSMRSTKEDSKPRRQKTLDEAYAEVLAAFPDADTNTVAAEEWTTNFPGAFARARAEKRPILMMVNSDHCPFCTRMRKALANPGFEKWLDGTGIYLANAVVPSGGNSTTNRTSMGDYMFRFLDEAPRSTRVVGFPYMGVFWEKPSGEMVWRTFTGRAGLLGIPHRPSMSCELANMLNADLSEYLAALPPRPDEGTMLSITAKQFKAAADGNGKVVMTPPHGTLVEDGTKIQIEAHPAKGWKIAGWRDPSGKMIMRLGRKTTTSRLDIFYSMKGGTYTAVFRKPAKAGKKQKAPLLPIGKP